MGVGEIGLDHTTKCKCKEHQTYHEKSTCRHDKIAAQNTFLYKMLYALKDIDTVIVIHSRGEDAAEIIRQKLIHFNLCEKRIHCQCFTGDKQEAILWMRTFKHVKFSISSKLLNSPELQESVQAIPSNKLLLESDSPYLSPNEKLNHPWNIKHHAELLASLKNLPLSLLMWITSINTRMLYQITQCEEISPVSIPHQIDQSIYSRQHILFNGPTTPFSNFFLCKLQYHNNTFNSTDQIYQWIKAIDVGDQFIAHRILQHEDPYAIKKCSNNLLPQAVECWQHKRGLNLMMELLDLKYDQVEEFCNACNHSQDALLFETTTDMFWGAGY